MASKNEMLIIGLFYILFPLLLLAMLVFKKHTNKLAWALMSLLTGVAILFIWTIARWEIVSIYFRPLFPVLFLIAIVVSYRRLGAPKPAKSKIASIISISLNVMVIFFLSVMSWLALRGYKTPDNLIELASPLRDGKNIVLHGGSRPMVNAHFHVNPQNYALDIVGLNKLGMRASSIAGGSNLNDYVIYGRDVYSPVDGRVILVVDEFEDLIPPRSDVKNLAGNHILIASQGNEILLAHLKKGSILVKPGDLVTTSTVLGQVGNTGNTSEPHLHMHIETGGKAGEILNGKGVPFTINGHFLVRGDKLD